MGVWLTRRTSGPIRILPLAYARWRLSPGHWRASSPHGNVRKGRRHRPAADWWQAAQSLSVGPTRVRCVSALQPWRPDDLRGIALHPAYCVVAKAVDRLAQLPWMPFRGLTTGRKSTGFMWHHATTRRKIRQILIYFQILTTKTAQTQLFATVPSHLPSCRHRLRCGSSSSSTSHSRLCPSDRNFRNLAPYFI